MSRFPAGSSRRRWRLRFAFSLPLDRAAGYQLDDTSANATGRWNVGILPATFLTGFDGGTTLNGYEVHLNAGSVSGVVGFTAGSYALAVQCEGATLPCAFNLSLSTTS